MISKEYLEKTYLVEGNSMQKIADTLECSLNKVKYWMVFHKVKIRSISESIYLKNNPTGDPFNVIKPDSLSDSFLMGLGLGLYWGEGTKSNKYSIRLVNTDPFLILKFIEFMDTILGIGKNKLRFGVQIFSDLNPETALDFWSKTLKINRSQFQKVVITPTRGEGTYKRKIKHGVLTVYYHNKKLRDIVIGELKKIGFHD